jgi:hypothetical protein
MTSKAKIEANRRNARMSSGPRSSAGKARVSRNAVRHGIESARAHDEARDQQIASLAAQLAAQNPGATRLARIAAEAHVDMLRARQAKIDIVEHATQELLRTLGALSEEERILIAFTNCADILAACDRYERRALARRNRMMRALCDR